MGFLEKALEIKPKNASDWARKVPRFSLFSWDKAPIMKPDNAETRYWKGNLFLELGGKEKVPDACKMDLQSDSDYLSSLLRGGDLLCEFAEYSEAFKCFAKALKLSPGNEAAQQGKELCESKNGD